jgi:hypothetical protein
MSTGDELRKMPKTVMISLRMPKTGQAETIPQDEEGVGRSCEDAGLVGGERAQCQTGRNTD